MGERREIEGEEGRGGGRQRERGRQTERDIEREGRRESREWKWAVKSVVERDRKTNKTESNRTSSPISETMVTGRTRYNTLSSYTDTVLLSRNVYCNIYL